MTGVRVVWDSKFVYIKSYKDGIKTQKSFLKKTKSLFIVPFFQLFCNLSPPKMQMGVYQTLNLQSFNSGFGRVFLSSHTGTQPRSIVYVLCSVAAFAL